MPIILSNNTIRNSKIGVSAPESADIHASGNDFRNVGTAFDIRQNNEDMTILRKGGVELRLIGQWNQRQLSELVRALESDEETIGAVSKTSIGSYIKRKLADPVAFAAEVMSIASFFKS